MKTGFLLFEQYQGKKDIGSSRLRGHAIIRNWKLAGPDIGEAETFKHGGKYDVVFFQKAYFTAYAKEFKGVKIFDICDPDWFDWGYPFKEMIDACDAVTCSSVELTKAVARFTDKPVYFVPDRVELNTLPPPKDHLGNGPTKNIVWYGYSHNFPILDSTLPALAKRGLGLIVVSNDVFVQGSGSNIPVSNLPWSDHWMLDVQRGDVVINPQSKIGRWKYKSDNKTSIALALGMPVAHTDTELDKLLTEQERVEASKKGLELVKKEYDVLLSVVDYKEIIQEVLNNRKV